MPRSAVAVDLAARSDVRRLVLVSPMSSLVAVGCALLLRSWAPQFDIGPYILRSFSLEGRNAAIRARRAAGQRDHLPGLGEALGGSGHVAMQVGIHYISWWPPEEAGSKYSLSLSLEEDTDRIRRKPDRSIRINNLNEEEMLSEWKKLSSRSFDNIYRNLQRRRLPARPRVDRELRQPEQGDQAVLGDDEPSGAGLLGAAAIRDPAGHHPLPRRSRGVRRVAARGRLNRSS